MGISYGDYEPTERKKREVKETDMLCVCKVSKKATNFKTLVELVKQAEDILIQNGQVSMGERINTIRGIYYGTDWSLDYSVEKSSARSAAFTVYTGSSVKFDARKLLKCTEKCTAKLFESLFDTPEVFDNAYKAVDFGHLIIGLDSRRSWNSRNIKIPTQGGTGLELNTWIGDLGGGTATLSNQRSTNPSKRAKTMFMDKHSYGAMVNLEGDIAAYVVGMDEKNPNDIVDSTDNFKTIHEALQDYFNNKWNKRTFYFLAMLGAELAGNVITFKKNELIEECSEKMNDFSRWYLGNRMKDRSSGGMADFANASNHFKPVSEEIASIFIEALRHVVKNPEDMITARTDPNPTGAQSSTTYNIYKKGNDFYKKVNDELGKIKF